MTRFRDQPIGRKVSLLVLLASVVALSLAGLAVVLYEVSTVEPRVMQDLRSQAELVSANTEAALAFGDSVAAEENLQTLRVRPQIGAAALYDAPGDRFAAYTRAEDDLRPPLRVPPGVTGRQANYLRFSRYINVEGERLGTLVLWYELPSLWTRLQEYAIAAALVLLTLGLVSAILLLLLRTSVSRPILGLAEAARAVTERRNYHVRVPKYGDDELGRLTDAFNEMLSAIESSDEALRRSATQLQEALEAARLASWSYDPQSDRLV
ncbi:MAG: HAMP domain-containing protein, partial [Gemmatimonadota bacterium]|nr:HAMP domain-containing protein [Gemmatimonadota bacterium]